MLNIDSEFKELIPALSSEESEQLEKNILSEGIREPIILWQNIIIDGHNRYKIAEKHSLKYETIPMNFDSRDEVIDWMINNQLGRRNLSKETMSYLRGLQYTREKKKSEDNLKQNSTRTPTGQNVHSITTAEKLATQHNVDEKTIRRDEDYSKAVDTIVKNTSPKAKQKILNENIISNKDIKKISKLEPEKQKEVMNKLMTGEVKSVKACEILEVKELKEQQLKKEIKDTSPIVYNIDCNLFIDKMPMCDLLLTDPPYSTDIEDIESFVNTWLYKALDKVKDTGRAYIFIGAYPNEIKAYLNANIPQHIKLEQILIWTYKNTLGNNPKDKYKLNYQNCLYFKGINANNLDCPITNEQWAVQEINAPDGRLGDRYHTWQKPIEIADRFIRHSTKEKDIILDPFCCTGTFVLSANKLGRVGYGCDIDKANLDIAVKRGCKLANI